MTIDIVDLTDPQYADLNAVQLSMVRAAQSKKDGILKKAEEEKRQLFFLMLSRGVARSTALARERDFYDEEAAREIETVKADLNYQLAYESLASTGNEYGPYQYPSNPNYNLTPSQRFLIVRAYYMEATGDPDARLQAYAMDSLARSYLGEFYQTLYELLASYC